MTSSLVAFHPTMSILPIVNSRKSKVITGKFFGTFFLHFAHFLGYQSAKDMDRTTCHACIYST
jgi:hypothetical protein